MNRKAIGLLFVGVILLVLAVALAAIGVVADFPGPIHAIACLALALVVFILALYLIARAVRGVSLQSTALLGKIGTVILLIGAATAIYSAVAFFLVNDLPPNNQASRLPSLYLLFAGMFVMFVGTAMRNFRLHQ